MQDFTGFVAKHTVTRTAHFVKNIFKSSLLYIMLETTLSSRYHVFCKQNIQQRGLNGVPSKTYSSEGFMEAHYLGLLDTCVELIKRV